MVSLKIWYADYYKGKKLTPSYGGDAGYDLYYSGDKDSYLNQANINQLATGIYVAIPDGHYGLILEKSGLGMKYGTVCHGRVIDAGYRGEIIVLMSSIIPLILKPGSKIAQMIIQPFAYIKNTEFIEVTDIKDLGDTERGEKGFGSSGK